MELSDRFLNLVKRQLSAFDAEENLQRLVVYVAQTSSEEDPTLEAIGEWPDTDQVLPPVEEDPGLRDPSPARRWYPLQEGQILLGVIRAECLQSLEEWPDGLDKSLSSTAIVLTHCLSLELERNKLLDQLSHQRNQISLMVHQLRNPLTALRTYAELLLRRLGPENRNLNLVEGLLNEQAQLDRYISGLDMIGVAKSNIIEGNTSPLLLPPLLKESTNNSVRSLLSPLIDRASVTAKLQGYKWFGPVDWPEWTSDPCYLSNDSLAEILANLLENAFKYSHSGSSLGLLILGYGLCVWNQGNEIPYEEREKVFDKGFRGITSENSSGSGLGLALARELAVEVGGRLELIIPPKTVERSLPEKGNAFLLTVPRKEGQSK